MPTSGISTSSNGLVNVWLIAGLLAPRSGAREPSEYGGAGLSGVGGVVGRTLLRGVQDGTEHAVLQRRVAVAVDRVQRAGRVAAAEALEPRATRGATRHVARDGLGVTAVVADGHAPGAVDQGRAVV